MIEKFNRIVKVLFDAVWSLFECMVSDISKAKEECKDFLTILVKILLWDIPFYIAFGNKLDWKGNRYFEVYIVLKKWFWLAVDEVIIEPLRPLYFRGEDIYWLYYDMEMSWYVDDDWTKYREHVYKEDKPVIKEFLRDEFDTLKLYIPVLGAFIWRQFWRGVYFVFFSILFVCYKIGGNFLIFIANLLFRHLFFFVMRFVLFAVILCILFVFFQFMIFWVYVALLFIPLFLYLFVLGAPFFFTYKLLKKKPFFATRTRYRDMQFNPFASETKKVVTTIMEFLFMLKDRYRARKQMKKEQILLQEQTRATNERKARLALSLPLKESKVNQRVHK